jgi:hypothetical protein
MSFENSLSGSLELEAVNLMYMQAENPYGVSVHTSDSRNRVSL